MELPDKLVGIYKLTCRNNSKIYIGKSVNIKQRLKAHARGRDGYLFKRAIIKHGWDSFELEILEIVDNFNPLEDNEALLDREAYYIKLFDSSNLEKGYNLCERSNDTTGIKISEEHKEKISKASKGRIVSQETREKLRQMNLGVCRPHKPETKEKLRKAGLGRIQSEETKEKIGKKHLGKIVSEETKEKLRNKIVSPETREKMRLAQLGKPSNRLGAKHSEESKEKMRQYRLGKKLTEEEKEKRKGWKHTEESKEKIRLSQTGKLGHKHTEESKQKMRDSRIKYLAENNRNEN